MYHHVLLATDLADDMDMVVQRAAGLAAQGSVLTIVHVLEPLALAYGAEMPVDLASLLEEISKQARTRLDALADRLGVPRSKALLANGKIEREILRISEEQKIDVIVIGSHGRRGLGLLLGSTANAILHHAGCDVLAVRINRT
jgi:universal stress protein A